MAEKISISRAATAAPAGGAVSPPLAAPAPEPPPGAVPSPRQARREAGRLLEGWIIAILGAIAYTIVGQLVISDGHVVVFDAVDRLSRAYMVWWNEPAKLAAIGLSLTPMPTLVALPFALIKPLATSLAALPLISAIPAGGTLAMVNAAFARCEMSRALRYFALLIFAINPLFVYYAGNGTGVALGVFFVAAALLALVSWRIELATRYLVGAGLAMAFAALTFYPLIIWGIALGLAIVGLRAGDNVSAAKLESAAIVYLTPFAYAIMVWVLLNAIILGSPFGWLDDPSTYAAINAPDTIGQVGISLTEALGDLLSLLVGGAPVALVAVPALLLVGFGRQALGSWLALLIVLLAALIVANARIYDRADLLSLETALYLSVAGTIGLAWVHFASKEWRAVTSLVLLALLGLALPLSWDAMRNYPHQNQEQAFTRFIASGESQEGTISRGGYEVGIDPELEMAEAVKRVADGRKNVILTDNAQTYAVILLTGRPGLFVDRIDQGDDTWKSMRDSLPRGIEYVLVATTAPADEIVRHYPNLVNDGDNHFLPVATNSRYMLAKVAVRGDGKVNLRGSSSNLVTPRTPAAPPEEPSLVPGVSSPPAGGAEAGSGAGAGATTPGQTSAPTIEGQ